MKTGYKLDTTFTVLRGRKSRRVWTVPTLSISPAFSLAKYLFFPEIVRPLLGPCPRAGFLGQSVSILRYLPTTEPWGLYWQPHRFIRATYTRARNVFLACILRRLLCRFDATARIKRSDAWRPYVHDKHDPGDRWVERFFPGLTYKKRIFERKSTGCCFGPLPCNR